MEKYKKTHTKIILKYQPLREMRKINYLIDHILYQIFKIVSSISSKKHEAVTDNPPIRIHANKIENRNIFKIETQYYLTLLTPETMKLLGSTESKITKDENGENAPHLEITKVV